MDNSGTRKVTVADVARYAGVSPAVVSYVINDGPRPVAAATAERVRGAIEVLDYRPNRNAKALRTGRTGVLGLVLPGNADPFFGQYADAIYHAADDAGYGLLTASAGWQTSSETRLSGELARHSVDGILVVTTMTKADVPQLRWNGLPTVLLNCAFPVAGYSSIGIDVAAGAHVVVSHLLTTHDHRSVAMISGESDAEAPQTREAGWLDAHRLLGREPGRLERTIFSEAGGYQATNRLLANGERPSAIFASSDRQAFGIMLALREHDLEVPRDVALAGFDGIDQSRYYWPPLTTTAQPVSEMAVAAVQALLERQRPEHRVFQTSLRVRQSCGCPAPASAHRVR